MEKDLFARENIWDTEPCKNGQKLQNQNKAKQKKAPSILWEKIFWADGSTFIQIVLLAKEKPLPS